MYKPIQKYLHLEIAALLFLAYCLPLVIAKFFAADVKGVNIVLESVNSFKIIFLYLISLLFFSIPLLFLSRGSAWLPINPVVPVKLLLMINGLLGLLFAATKIYVYKYIAVDGYGFDTGAISDPIWTFSMFLSEVVVLISIMWLVLGRQKYFWLNIAMLQLNLLHGTRIYLMIAAIFIFQIFIRKLPKFKILVASIFSLLLFVAVSYLVYLIRQDAFESDFNLDVQWFFSPVLIESIFSQWSLVNVLSSNVYFSNTQLISFLLDPIIFLLPRFLFPEKESMLLAMDPELSPLGALNGIATSVIYFGYFFPIYWFFWGAIGASLLRLSKRSYWFRVAYLLFSFNLILRLVRDGYVLPSKILINDVILIVIMLSLFKLVLFSMRGKNSKFVK